MWTAIAGVELWGGPVLNLFLVLLSGLLLFLLGQLVLPSRLWASLLVACWALSPMVLNVTVETRPYTLVATWSILFFYLLARWQMGVRNRWLWLGLAICTAGGLLTNFQFALLVGGAGLVVVAQSLAWGEIKQAVRPILSMLSGTLLFAMVHPGFWMSFVRQRAQTDRCHPGELMDRAQRIVVTFGEFVAPPAWLIPVSVLLSVVVVGLVLVQRRWPVNDGRSGLSTGRSPLLFLMTMLAVVVVAMSLFYLRCFTPYHAMAPKYLAMVLPLLALVPFVMVSRIDHRIAIALLTLICLWQLAYAAQSTRAFLTRMQSLDDADLVWQDAPAILLDSTARGVLPTILWHMPSQTPIFAGMQVDLLADPNQFLSSLAPGALYISDLRYGNTAEQQSRIVRAIEEKGWVVTPHEGSVFGVGHIFVVQPSEKRPAEQR